MVTFHRGNARGLKFASVVLGRAGIDIRADATNAVVGAHLIAPILRPDCELKHGYDHT